MKRILATAEEKIRDDLLRHFTEQGSGVRMTACR
jgi:hypothetical protein